MKRLIPLPWLPLILWRSCLGIVVFKTFDDLHSYTFQAHNKPARVYNAARFWPAFGNGYFSCVIPHVRI